MTICEDAPCCGCCGTSLYGSEEERWPTEHDIDFGEDFIDYHDDEDGDYNGEDDPFVHDPREDFGWAGMTE
jgi:hypothetical protein